MLRSAMSSRDTTCGISPRSRVVRSRDPDIDQRAPPDVRGNDASHLTKGGNTGMTVGASGAIYPIITGLLI